MKSIITHLLLLMLATGTVAAEQPELQAELPAGQEVYEGDAVRYRITLSNAESSVSPQLTGFDDFTVDPRGVQTMESRQLDFRDGQPVQIVRQSRIYEYLLTPKRSGTLTIPAPTVEVAGRVVQGEALKLRVIAPQQQDLARLEILVDKPAVYPTQAFTVTLRVAVKSLPEPLADRDPIAVLRRLPVLSIPWATEDAVPAGVKPQQSPQTWLEGLLARRRGGGFSINNLRGGTGVLLFDDGPLAFLPPGRPTPRPAAKDQAARYWEYEFPREFVAERVGKYSWGPVSLKGALGSRLTASGDLALEPVFARAQPVTVTVQDAPQKGRPASYAGAIGVFELHSELSPTTVKVGDPLTLTLALRGQGTLDAFQPPDLAQVPEVAQQFKVYQGTESAADGERRFTYSLRPTTAAVTRFPAVSLPAYFDVQREAFVTLRTDEVPLQVTQAESLQSQQLALAPAAKSGGREIETQEGGIFANDSALDALRDESVRPGHWLAGLGGLTGTYLALLLMARRVQRLHADPYLRRRRAAAARAQQRLQEAKRCGGGREETDALQAALIGLVADAVGLPEAGMTSAEACQQLLQLELEPALIQRVSAWFEACDAARYGAGQQTLHGLEDTAAALLAALVPALRQAGRLQ